MTKKTKIIVIVITFLVTLLITGVATFSKYLKDTLYNYYLESNGFYLSSLELGNNKVNTNMLWDGNRVYFKVNNYLNNNKINKYDIDYTVTCSIIDDPNLRCSLNGENTNSLTLRLNHDEHCIDEENDTNVSSYDKDTCSEYNYTWKNHQAFDELYFEVVANTGTVSDANVLVTVNATSPYQKQLTGTFKLHKIETNNDISFEVTNKDLYHELVITNKGADSKCLQVSFNSNNRILLNDQSLTNVLVDNNGYINSFKVQISALNNKKIQIFSKTNNLNNDFTDITVVESNGC